MKHRYISKKYIYAYIWIAEDLAAAAEPEADDADGGGGDAGHLFVFGKPCFFE